MKLHPRWLHQIFFGCSFFFDIWWGSGAYNSQNAGYPTYGASYGYDAYGGYEGYDSQSYSWEAQRWPRYPLLGFDDLMVGESNWPLTGDGGLKTMVLHIYLGLVFFVW